MQNLRNLLPTKYTPCTVRYANTQIDTKTMLIIISYHYCHHRLHSLCITKRKCLLNIPLDQAKLSISYTQTHAGLHTCGRGFEIVRGCLLKGRGLSSSSYVHCTRTHTSFQERQCCNLLLTRFSNASFNKARLLNDGKEKGQQKPVKLIPFLH